MDSPDGFAALPDAYASALQLQAAGAGMDEIAQRLNIDAEAVPALLRLADAKLEMLNQVPSRSREVPVVAQVEDR